MNKLTTERLSTANIKDLRILYRSVYKKDCGDAYFPMKYDTAFTGTQYIGYLAYDNGAPVAYYGVIPTIMSVQQKPVLAAQSCDTMTHPSYRKQGWFVKLARMTFTLAKQEGIHFIFGFPNQNSYPGFIKHLGFTHQETMSRFSLTFPSSIYHKLYFRAWTKLASKSTTGIRNPLTVEGFDGILYSPDWQRYKQYSKSTIIDTPFGQGWIKTMHSLWLGTADLGREQDMQSFIQKVAKTTKTPAITLMASPGTAFGKSLEKFSPPQNGFAVITKNLSGVYKTDRLKFQLSDLDIF